jgi:hypothetical protein
MAVGTEKEGAMPFFLKKADTLDFKRPCFSIFHLFFKWAFSWWRLYQLNPV